ncbi:isopentenyl diphosphate isomerase/L-lactate dehydrogenase-like FMN-dependent dehydrogenase [Streptacidiphilus sp. MAP12-33]|uniref:glutamate synthase-related protein n=1 Tax=Streptacidiphilus sp. MAP12-33 TaxID=3156266 RepID=UPI003512A046
MTGLSAQGFPEGEVRRRARLGAAAAFPAEERYGHVLFGAEGPQQPAPADQLDGIRLAEPVFMPLRLEKLIELGREPLHTDVDLTATIGGFASALPLYLSAFGSTRAAGTEQLLGAARQAGRLGIPMVIGENIVPITGYGRAGERTQRSVLDRIHAYTAELPDRLGGLAVQQSTEDADAEVWNLVYSDPGAQPLLESGRLAFELKVGQGAKPGLGGLTVLDRAAAAKVDEQFALEELYGEQDRVLRVGSPGTFTEEILRQQVRLMRNNYPRARVWVKLHPGRDVAAAARVAWAAGADAVTVDGAEGGTGWAPTALIQQVGLPLGECLLRIAATDEGAGPLLASGRMWEGARAAKALALGAGAVGLGRAALVAADEDPARGLTRLVEALALELRMLTSALGKYHTAQLAPTDLWSPDPHTDSRLAAATARAAGPQALAGAVRAGGAA